METGDFDCHVGLGADFHGNQSTGRGYSDGNENNYRNDGPDDFGLGTVGEFGRFMSPGFAVQNDGSEHRGEYDDTNDHAHPQNGHMQSIIRM